VQLLRLTAKDLGVEAPETETPPGEGGGRAGATGFFPDEGTGEGDSALRPMVASFWEGTVKGAKIGLVSGWKAFADTMDSVFVGEPTSKELALAQQRDPEAAGESPVSNPERSGARPSGAALGVRGAQDVPMIFRLPSNEEVREQLELEGIPAYVGVAGGRGFLPKRLCLDSSGSPSLYVLEPESSVPSVFFGMSGFALNDLRRVVVGAAPSHPGAKPLMSLEFQEGFLPVRLGDAMVLRGLVGLLCSGRGNVEVVQRPDWV